MNHWWIVWGATPDVSTTGLFAGRDDKGNVVVGAGGWESPMPHNYDEVRATGFMLCALLVS